MPINRNLLQIAGKIGLIKGKTLSSIKQQVVKNAANPQQGRRDFNFTKRAVLRPLSGVAVSQSQFKKAVEILGEAKALKSQFRNQPATLLQKARNSMIQAEMKEQKEKEEKTKKTSRFYISQRRAEEEAKRELTPGDTIDRFLKERGERDENYRILQEARGAVPPAPSPESENKKDENPTVPPLGEQDSN